MKKHPKSSKGFSHHFLLPLLVILAVGCIGVYTMMQSRAASILPEDSYFPSDSSYTDESIAAVLDEDSEDTSTPPVVTAPTGSSVSLATWNVLKYDNSVASIRGGVQEIFASGAGIIGLQEISKPSFTKGTPKAAVKEITSVKTGVYSPEGGSAIVWDTAKYKKLAADSWRPVKTKEKRFVYVKFQEISSGKKFYVLNLHMQPNVNNKPENCSTKDCKRFKEQMRSLVSKIKALQKSKLPIFVIGDFNVDYKLDSKCSVSWYPCKALGKIGMKSSYKALKLKNTDGYGSAKKYIDHAYYWTAKSTQTTPVSNKILGTGSVCVKSKKHDIDGDTIVHCWNGSDHKPLIFTAKLGQ